MTSAAPRRRWTGASPRPLPYEVLSVFDPGEELVAIEIRVRLRLPTPNNLPDTLGQMVANGSLDRRALARDDERRTGGQLYAYVRPTRREEERRRR